MLAQSEMEHNFPLEATDDAEEAESTDNDYSYSTRPNSESKYIRLNFTEL